MEETNKYFKVIDPNNEMKKDIIIMIKPEDVDKSILRFENAGYKLRETECPKDVTLISLPEERPKMPNLDALDCFDALDCDPFLNTKHERYNGPCCGRCANRFKLSDFCTNHCQSSNCYRFKLEK